MGGKPAAHKGTVLVVDDAPTSLRLMRDMLSADGYEVMTANGGELALSSLARTLPDLILLDIRMPDMNGFEMCRHLKEQPETQDIPVIFISAVSELEDKVEGFAAGAVDYISKPFQRGELLARVRTHLQLRRLQTEQEALVRVRTAALERSNRAYQALSACNRLLALASSEAQLLAEACGILHEICGYHLVWIGMAESDEKKSVRPVAQAGFQEEYLADLQVSWAEDEHGRGPTGTAIRTGKPAINRDTRTNPDFAPWRDLALRHDYLSSAGFPLMDEGHCLGALLVYSDQIDAFTEEEIRLLTELAANLACGVRLLRMQVERSRADEELRQHREHLEELVAQRTALMESANREMEDFLYSISHDLRTPLRAIDGFSGMLEKKYAEHMDPEERRLLGVVRSNSARMSQLIDDILAFSHSGHKALRVAPIDMGEMVLGVWKDLSVKLATRKLHLDLGPLPPARGDPVLLRQVWINLLVNAIKFTRPRTEGRIDIRGERRENELLYSVKDNGVGFDPAYTHKLFGVFQRLHGIEEFEGTGIGLAIVKRIVGRHGGQVMAEGRPGEGATIRFSLPDPEGSSAAAPGPEAAAD